MAQPPSASHSVVARIAQSLRTRALASEPGAYIGSEESLSRELQVSGPTLRQAIRLLEHEELVQVKRGLHGGYFARRPDLETISRVAAVYLRGNLNSFDEILIFLEYVQPLLVDLVMASPRLQELEPFAAPESAADNHDDFIDRQSRFSNLIHELSGNAPLRLIYTVFFTMGSGIELKPVTSLNEGILAVQDIRIKLAQALLAGDRQGAIALAIAQCRAVHAGLKRNLEASKPPLRA